MADIGRIITTGAKTKVGKEFTKDLIEQAQGLIKTGKRLKLPNYYKRKRYQLKLAIKKRKS